MKIKKKARISSKKMGFQIGLFAKSKSYAQIQVEI